MFETLLTLISLSVSFFSLLTDVSETLALIYVLNYTLMLHISATSLIHDTTNVLEGKTHITAGIKSTFLNRFLRFKFNI